MTKEIRCSGLMVPCNAFSEATANRIIGLLPVSRGLFEPAEDEWRGSRYSDDSKVVWAIKSAATEDEFNADASRWVTAALHYLAGSDHWYRWEKDWGEEV